jgi:hypothetical protein
MTVNTQLWQQPPAAAVSPAPSVVSPSDSDVFIELVDAPRRNRLVEGVIKLGAASTGGARIEINTVSSDLVFFAVHIAGVEYHLSRYSKEGGQIYDGIYQAWC